MEKTRLTGVYKEYRKACNLLNGKTYEDAKQVKGITIVGDFPEEEMFDFEVGDCAVFTFSRKKVCKEGIDVWRTDDCVSEDDFYVGAVDLLDPNYIWE